MVVELTVTHSMRFAGPLHTSKIRDLANLTSHTK